jgi:hypothetical protein
MRTAFLPLFALATIAACGSASDPPSTLGGTTAIGAPSSPAPEAGSPEFAGGDGGGAQEACAPGTTRACYPFTGGGAAGVGACKAGTQACSKSGEFGTWGACTGAVGPSAEVCGDSIDNDCNGTADDGCTPEAGAPIDAEIEFHHLADTAAWTNCLKIQVNGGPETDLGCNHGGAAVATAKVVANSAPFCNIVRLNLYSNGAFNKSTADAAQVAASFIIQQIGTSNFSVQCNDNNDNDYNDLNLTMNAVGAVSFTIENSGIPCN